ncbi:MAG: DeoR/GlpR transcriptional regulator, partial [Lachnospiraceae bacterium]|nr:DeoR/GlpR transcriptional regulator [Lachnospiraceae bacterium]
IIGEYASAFISNFRADIAFISSKAITTQGIFEGDDSQALCKKEMIKNSFKTVLLLDNSKEFKEGYFKLADFSDFDVIVSNGEFGDGIMKEIDMSNCKLLF